MGSLTVEAAAFRSRQENERREAAQRAALQLSCGIDLDDALNTAGPARLQVIAQVERSLRCERIKGLGQHWSYDLNRHIALKQVRDLLLGASPASWNQKRRPKDAAKRS